MIAYPLTAWIILSASWPTVFYVSALLGFAWVGVWLWFSKDHPREHPAMTAHELQAIEASRFEEPAVPTPLRKLLLSVPVLMLSGGAMCFAFVLWTFLFWFPTYLIEARGLSLKAVATAGLLIQGCGFLGTVSSGVVSDWLLRKTGRPRVARTLLAGSCVTVAAVMLVSAVEVADTTLALLLFALFYFALMTVHVAFLATPATLHPRRAATIYGMINCCASTGAVCGPALIGVPDVALEQLAAVV